MSVPETLSRRSATTTKVFVGNLPANATAKDLRELFTPYGPIAECDIAIRCGFLHLEDKELAIKAIEELNNTTFMGVRISVEKGRVKPPNRGRGGRGGSGGGPMRGGGKDRAGPYSRDGFERSPGGRGSYGGRDFPPYGDRYGYDRGGRFDGYDDRRQSGGYDDRRGGDSFGRPYPNGFDRRPAYDDRPYPAVSGGGYDDRRMPPASGGGYDERRGSMGGDRRPLMDQQMTPTPRPAQSYDRSQPDMYSRRDNGPKPVDRSVSNYSTASTGYGSPAPNAYGSQGGSAYGGYGDTRSSGSIGGYDSRGAVQPGAYGDSRAPLSQGYDTRGAAPAMSGGMYDSRGSAAPSMGSYGAPAMGSYSNTTAATGYDTYGAARNGSYDAAYPPLPQQRGFASGGGGPTPRRDMPPGPGRRY